MCLDQIEMCLPVSALIDVDLLDFSASTSTTPTPTPGGRRSQAGVAHSQRISGTRWVCLDLLLLFCPVVIGFFGGFLCVGERERERECVCVRESVCVCERESVCVCVCVCVCVASPFVSLSL